MMPYIETYTGRRLDPFAPDIDQIDIVDIAHALALTCRFNGHSARFYSVAHHSILAARLAKTREIARQCLMHDAAEAYFGDIVRPIKAAIPAIEAAETALLAGIAGKFRLPYPFHGAVGEIDDRLLATEAIGLLGADITDWGLGVMPYDLPIIPMSPEEGEHRFLELFEELFGDRDD